MDKDLILLGIASVIGALTGLGLKKFHSFVTFDNRWSYCRHSCNVIECILYVR
ncbi:hypothetical protein [Wolbachia endosymbiont of Wuchereria bancrofti]|uniref:hypothetical protein n=1 Tax=Wolbachia endosymbiont of Wuchereria bancrofti TaxID=96496 RepID=UPI000B65B367|nr:hypothetical protein [Wolbachia endosymbiont of Wuchereria bancrofti]OWZ24918.1 hypothetical protein CCY16_00399 [Wolbachia endosymbiont of Wuchereria bancrofti]